MNVETLKSFEKMCKGSWFYTYVCQSDSVAPDQSVHLHSLIWELYFLLTSQWDYNFQISRQCSSRIRLRRCADWPEATLSICYMYTTIAVCDWISIYTHCVTCLALCWWDFCLGGEVFFLGLGGGLGLGLLLGLTGLLDLDVEGLEMASEPVFRGVEPRDELQ